MRTSTYEAVSYQRHDTVTLKSALGPVTIEQIAFLLDNLNLHTEVQCIQNVTSGNDITLKTDTISKTSQLNCSKTIYILNFSIKLFKDNIHTKRIFDIICVYAPADHSERKPFYDDLINYIKSYQNHNLIMCGDFNFVDSEVDRRPKLIKYDKRFSKIFKPKNYHLNDAFRIKNPVSIEFTHKTARLARIYISDSILNTLHKAKHLHFLADHKPVMIQLNIEDIQFWGKSYWKMNHY